MCKNACTYTKNFHGMATQWHGKTLESALSGHRGKHTILDSETQDTEPNTQEEPTWALGKSVCLLG